VVVDRHLRQWVCYEHPRVTRGALVRARCANGEATVELILPGHWRQMPESDLAGMIDGALRREAT
jgi:hypothetical protein